MLDVGKATKQSNNVQIVKDKSQTAAQPSTNGADIRKFVDEIIDKTSTLVLSEVGRIFFSQL